MTRLTQIAKQESCEFKSQKDQSPNSSKAIWASLSILPHFKSLVYKIELLILPCRAVVRIKYNLKYLSWHLAHKYITVSIITIRIPGTAR